MKQPVTALDSRFSEPGARATEWDETHRLLEQAELFWISTVRADGRPHVTPLVAVWLEDAVYFCTGPTEQKAVNLRANPNVILTTGCNQWDRGLDIVVEGEAVQVTDEDLLERLGRELWSQTSHAAPPHRRVLQDNAKRWLRGNLPTLRKAVCGNDTVQAVRANANPVTLAAAVADVLASVIGIPATGTVAVLITRIGLDKLCAEEAPV
jgi:general stress protein 26